MRVRHALGVPVHLLPKSHGLLADARACVVDLVAACWRHTGPSFRGAHHILIELHVGELLRVSVLLHTISISATVICMTVNVSRLANV